MKSISSALTSTKYAGAVFGICVGLCVIALRTAGYLQSLELGAYDCYSRMVPQALPADPRILLITISEEDIHFMGAWPLTDALLAHVLEHIIALGPRVVGVDIYRDIPVPPGEKRLTNLLQQNCAIITVKKTGDDGSPGIPGPYMLEDLHSTGFNDILLDPDGRVRRGLLFLDDGNEGTPSFSLLLALHYLAQESISPQPDAVHPHHLRLGKGTFIPFEPNDGGYAGADARGYQFLLDFRGVQMGFRSCSLKQLLSGSVTREEVRDTIVIIGTVAESLHDLFYTPLSRERGFLQAISGIELHALMTSQILRAALEGTRPIQSFNERIEWAWILLWGLLGGVFSLWGSSLVHRVLTVVCGLIILVAGGFFSFIKGVWMPVAPPACALFLSAAVMTALAASQERLHRTRLMQLFSRHVSERVAKILWDTRDQSAHGGRPLSQRLFATVLFADLKGFTSVAERLDPEDLMEWLNEFMEGMTLLVSEYGGVVNKYLGDGILAIFGAPVSRECEKDITRDALNAVDCALAMSGRLRDLNTRWRRENLPTTHLRIGIFAGPLVAGCIGSRERMEYTVLGDTVNIASRLEGLYKEVDDPDLEREGCRIFIGDSLLLHLRHLYEIRLVGTARLRGKGKPTTVYRVIGRKVGEPM